MKEKYFLLVILLFCYKYLCAYDFLDITKFGYEQYQDIFINGRLIKKGIRDCESRYQIIKKVVEKYKRPITILDIGASQGYFSFRLASDFPKSTCVMIEGENGEYPLSAKQLLDLCRLNTALNNIIFLSKAVTLEDLQRLGECEHFDIVLAFNVIHHLHGLEFAWSEVAQAILNLGETIIVEHPQIEPGLNQKYIIQRQDIKKYLLKNGARLIGQVERHTSNIKSEIFLINREKKYLERTMWLKNEKTKKHKIISTIENKILQKPFDTNFCKVMWQPGINLMTFKMLNGVFPSKEVLRNALVKLSNIKTNDFRPNNMILQGNNILLIDCDGPEHNKRNDVLYSDYVPCAPERIDSIKKLIDIDDSHDVEQFFWNEIINI